MKKLLFGLSLVLTFLIGSAQGPGYLNLNDFPTPYPHSRFWLRGATPAGSVAVLEAYGTNKLLFYTDTLASTKLHLQENANPYKLLWIDNNGLFKAVTPPYLKTSDTTGKWLSVNTSFLSPSDTVGKWLPITTVYLKPSDTTGKWLPISTVYLKPSDTINKWLPIGTVIPAAQVNSDWTASSGISQILNKPVLSTVAISGSYNDLSNKPTIPAAQVNSDWNSVSGVSQILNKPSIPAAQVNSDWNSVSGVSQILNKPTIPAAQIQSDWNQTNTAALDYIKNKPTGRRIETFLGTTDGSGNYTVTFGTAYASIPDIQPQLQAGTPSQVVRITARSTTGFTVQVTNRGSVNLLGFEILLAATTAVSGSSVSVLVTER